MDCEISLTHQADAWLTGSVLSAQVVPYVRYLVERRYSVLSIRNYLNCIVHFSYWLKKRQDGLHCIDELLVQRFLDAHLPRCDCPGNTQRSRHQVRAALSHLLIVLRASNAIPAQADPTPRSIRDEVGRFDTYLVQVCSLANATRSRRIGIVREFLVETFGAAAVDITRVTPQNVYRFVISQTKGCQPSTAKITGGALRSYLRFRAVHGDGVQALMAAIPQIAEWRLSSLPDVLTEAELDQFLQAFDQQTATGRRDYAMA